MNLGIEDAYVFAALVAERRLEDYERLRRPVVSCAKLAAAIPRIKNNAAVNPVIRFIVCFSFSI
jgi:2-polyprenyl-6-methoxyphenol hydroxylase-like FAD-dependent oxidoreductase